MVYCLAGIILHSFCNSMYIKLLHSLYVHFLACASVSVLIFHFYEHFIFFLALWMHVFAWCECATVCVST